VRFGGVGARKKKQRSVESGLQGGGSADRGVPNQVERHQRVNEKDTPWRENKTRSGVGGGEKGLSWLETIGGKRFRWKGGKCVVNKGLGTTS